MVAGIQGSRMNDQRAALPDFPGLHNSQEVLDQLMTNKAATLDDGFFEMLMRCQVPPACFALLSLHLTNWYYHYEAKKMSLLMVEIVNLLGRGFIPTPTPLIPRAFVEISYASTRFYFSWPKIDCAGIHNPRVKTSYFVLYVSCPDLPTFKLQKKKIFPNFEWEKERLIYHAKLWS